MFKCAPWHALETQPGNFPLQCLCSPFAMYRLLAGFTYSEQSSVPTSSWAEPQGKQPLSSINPCMLRVPGIWHSSTEMQWSQSFGHASLLHSSGRMFLSLLTHFSSCNSSWEFHIPVFQVAEHLSPSARLKCSLRLDWRKVISFPCPSWLPLPPLHCLSIYF